MTSCVFCKIVEDKLKANKLFENDSVLIFEPAESVSRGHVLVIPKKHYKDIFETPENTLSDIMSAIRLWSEKTVDELDAGGVNILNASGVLAQQSVFHLHFHVVPRYENDGLDMWIRQGL